MRSLRIRCSSSSNSRAVRSSARSPRNDLVGVGVQPQVADHQEGAAARRAAAQQRAHPREQLVALEGLHQVVVGAGVEALHARVHGVARGEHQDRHVAVLAQPPADLHAVELGQAEVEHHGVGLEDAGLLERGLAVARHPHLVALHVERAAQHAGDVGVVLHHEHARPRRSSADGREGGRALRRKSRSDGHAAEAKRTQRRRKQPHGGCRRHALRLPRSTRDQLDLIGLGLVAFAAFFASSSTSAGPAARWARRWPTAPRPLRRRRLPGAGRAPGGGRACMILRPMLPRRAPVRAGRALPVRRASRSASRRARWASGPGDTRPRRLPRPRLPARPRRRRRASSLLSASSTLFSGRRRAHPVRLPATGRRAAADRRLARRGRQRHPAGRGHHHAARAQRPQRATLARPRDPAASLERPRPRPLGRAARAAGARGEPVVHATHVEAPALDGAERYPDLFGDED